MTKIDYVFNEGDDVYFKSGKIDYAFKNGDVVYLKSGSPPMTISEIEYVQQIIPGWLWDTYTPTKEIGLIKCIWVDKNNHSQWNWFRPCVLTYVSTDVKLFNEYFGSVA